METKLFNGDCLEVMKSIPDGSIDLVLTDPPYLFVKGGKTDNRWSTGSWKKDSYAFSRMGDFGENEIYNFLNVVTPKMKKINMYIFCSKLQLQYYFKWILDHKKIKYDLLVWNKQKVAVKSHLHYANDIEYIIKLYEPKVTMNAIHNGEKLDSEYYRKIRIYKHPMGEHETMKPVEMLRKFIEISSNENDTILDPFMGSGSTGIGCYLTNRNFIGIELNKNYFDIATKRIEDAKKEKEYSLFN